MTKIDECFVLQHCIQVIVSVKMRRYTLTSGYIAIRHFILFLVYCVMQNFYFFNFYYDMIVMMIHVKMLASCNGPVPATSKGRAYNAECISVMGVA